MKNENRMKNIFFIALAMSFVGILPAESKKFGKNKPEPIGNFKVERYLGTWYEIGRFDFKWEKNLKNVTANYSMNENGTIKVTNSGFDYKAGKEKQSVGKAKFATKRTDVADLKVSFFGPFYSNYTVIAMDANYSYALVAGANKKLLWILSRTKTIPENIKADFMQKAQTIGYDFSDFIWTMHD